MEGPNKEHPNDKPTKESLLQDYAKNMTRIELDVETKIAKQYMKDDFAEMGEVFLTALQQAKKEIKKSLMERTEEVIEAYIREIDDFGRDIKNFPEVVKNIMEKEQKQIGDIQDEELRHVVAVSQNLETNQEKKKQFVDTILESTHQRKEEIRMRTAKELEMASAAKAVSVENVLRAIAEYREYLDVITADYITEYAIKVQTIFEEFIV